MYIYIYIDTKSSEERIKQRAEEIHVRIGTLEEHEARFTEGHKKQDEDNKIQKQNLEEMEDKFVKNQWELKEEDRKIDHKLKILEEKEQQFENSTLKAMKTLEDKLKMIEEREIQLLKGNNLFPQLCRWVYIYISFFKYIHNIYIYIYIYIYTHLDTKSSEERIEQRAEEIYVRIRILEEHDTRFTKGHKKKDEESKALEFRTGKQRKRVVKRANKFYGYVSGSVDKSLIFMDNQLNVVHKYRGKKAKQYSRILQLQNNLIAASNYNGNIEIIDPISHKLISTLTGHVNGHDIFGLYELGNGQLVSASDDKTIRLWDTEEGKCLQIFKGHKGNVYAILEHSSGDLISGSGDKTNRVWNVGTGICSKIIPGFEGVTWWILELTDGRILSVCQSQLKSLRIWDFKTGEVINDITSCYHMGWAAACIVNEEIIVLGGRGLVAEFNVPTLEFGRKFSDVHAGWIEQIVMGGEDIYISCSYDETVQMFNMKSKQILHSMTQHTGIVCSVIGLQIKDQGY